MADELTPEQRARLEELRAVKAAKTAQELTPEQRTRLAQLRDLKRAKDEVRKLNETSPIEYAVEPYSTRGASGYRAVPKHKLKTAYEGYGTRAVRAYRGAGNILQKAANAVVPGQIFDTEASDENLSEMDRLNAPLKETAEGQLGGLVADVAPYVAASPLGPSTQAIKAMSVLPRVAHTIGRPAAEGAIQAATTAKVGEQGEDALKGAILSTVFNRLFAGGARTATGLGQENFAARRLAEEAEAQGRKLHIPANLALAEGPNDVGQGYLTKALSWLYRGPLSRSIISGSQLSHQAEELGDEVSKMLVKSADPKNVLSEADLLDPRAAATVLKTQARKDVREAIGDVKFSADPTFIDTRVRDIVSSNFKDMNKETLDRIVEKVTRAFKDNGELSGTGFKYIRGSRLGDVQDALNRAIDNEGLSATQREGLQKSLGVINDVLSQPMVPQSQLPNLVKRLEEARTARQSETSARVLEKSAGGEGEALNPSKVAREAVGKDAEELSYIAGQARDLTATQSARMRRVDFPTLVRSLPGMGGRGALTYFFPQIGIPAVAAEAALGTKTAQNFLLGRQNWQQSLAKALRDNAKKIQAAETAVRMGTVSDEEL